MTVTALTALKGVAKAIVAVAGAAAIVLADGHATPAEVCLAIVTVGGVYGIRNGTAGDQELELEDTEVEGE